jgi:hypothetical protein
LRLSVTGLGAYECNLLGNVVEGLLGNVVEG